MTIRRQIEAALVAAMAFVAVLGFRSVFLDESFLIPAAVAAAVVLAISIVSVRSDMPLPVSLAASLVLYLVIGTLLVQAQPSIDGVREFIRSSVNGWSTLLTTAAPTPVEGAAAAVPFAVAWFGGFVGAEIALRTTRSALPLVGPLGALILTVLFGVDDTDVVLWSAGLFLVLALVFLALRSQSSWFSPTPETTRPVPSRAASALTLVVASALLAPLVAPALPLANDRQRFTLREEVDVDFDLRQLPSPLASLKGSLTEQRSGDVLFTVAGPSVDRIRLAILDSYDGAVWSIARSQNGNEFVRVGSTLPDVDAQADDATVQTHTVTVNQLDGFWMPTTGVPAKVWFNDQATSVMGTDPADLLRFDDKTGSLLLAAEQREGLTYRMETYPVVRPPDAELAALEVWSGGDRLTQLPDSVDQLEAVAADITRGRDSAFGKAAALEAFFAEQFYNVETLTGHTARHLVDLFSRDQLQAFDERYAAGFAVLARLSGLPARVVVGYRAPAGMGEANEAVVRAGDIEAWVEIAFEGVGWVPFDAGPDEERTIDSEGGSQRQQETSAAPPPPPQRRDPVPETTVPPEDDPGTEPDDESNTSTGIAFGAPAVAAGLTVGLIVLLLGLFAVGVLLIKWRRRRKRQRAETTAAQVAGAWQEFVDRSTDAGIDFSRGLTVRETVAEVAAARPLQSTARLNTIGDLVERTAFHPNDPSTVDAQQSWQLVDASVGEFANEESIIDRTKRKLSTRSLRMR